jgi:hypothetical protein
MPLAIVTAKKALLRDVPGGTALETLAKGTIVDIQGGPGAWAEVTTGDAVGVVSRRSLAYSPDGMPAPRGLTASRSVTVTIPPEGDAADIRVVGTSVRGPGGLVFGKLFKLGLFNFGQTSLDRFLDQDPGAFPGLSASVLQVMRAVSANEGKIEAINTWDNAVLSCSIYQWTVSEANGAGELPFALSVLKARSPTTFTTYFGKYGLDVAATPPKPFAVGRGHFLLNGRRLDSGPLKSPLRSHLWAYRFWRAAHDPEVRRAYVKTAIDRIPVFHDAPVAALGNRPLSRYVTSELAVAHLLDQHVNRPGHVPKTIAQAIAEVAAARSKPDPANWGDTEERAVISRYLTLRHATSMTDSVDRAKRIQDAVAAGRLSDRRGSYR